MNRADVLEKIRKLYALAGSSNEGEAKAALQAADLLVQKYRIEQQELGGKPAFSLDLDPIDVGRGSVWRHLVLGALCYRYGVRTVIDPCGTFMFGTEDDKAIVRVMYDRISAQLNAMAIAHAKGRGRLFADSFRTGVARAVCDMIAPEQATAPSDSTALATLNNRGEQAMAELQKIIPGLTVRQPPKAHINTEAYKEGKEHGKHIHLGESLDSGTAGALPGKTTLPGWDDT